MKVLDMDSYVFVITDEPIYKADGSCFSYRHIHTHDNFVMVECVQTKKCECISLTRFNNMKQTQLTALVKK